MTSSPFYPSVASTEEFLRALFHGTEGQIEYRCIEDHRGGHSERAWLSLEGAIQGFDMINTRSFLGGRAVFYGVLPREQGKGTSEDTLPSRVVFADCDFKDVSEEETWRRIVNFALQPSIIVHSGRGLHLYWLLRENFSPETLSDCSQRVAFALGADHCFDAARILRVPGSKNLKACWDDSSGSWVYTPSDEAPVCAVVLFEPERTHALLDFLHLPEAPTAGGKTARGEFDREKELPGEDLDPVVLAWLDKDERLLELWCSQGKVDGDTSNSGYDISFAKRLVELGITNPDVLDAAVNARPRTDDRERTEREIYRAVDAALSMVIEAGEVGIADVEGVREFFERRNRKPRASNAPGDGTSSTADPEEDEDEDLPKSEERIAWEKADTEVSRIQKILSEWEAKLPAANELLSALNEVRQQRRLIQDRLKAASKTRPLTPHQIHDVPAVVQVLEQLVVAHARLARLQEEDKHLILSMLNAEDLATRREVLSSAKRAIRVLEQALKDAEEVAQAVARQPLIDAVREDLTALEALEAQIAEARTVIATVKEGRGRLKDAQAARAKAKKAMLQAEGAFVPDAQVMDSLRLNHYGEVVGNNSAILAIFENDPYFKNYFSLDTLSSQLYLQGKPSSDNLVFRLCATLENVYGIPNVPKERVHDAAWSVGWNNAFSPITRALDKLVYKGTTYVKDFLRVGCGARSCSDTGILELISIKFLISMVARAYVPGCKMDTMLVLSGSEGTRKSSMLSALVALPGLEGVFSDSDLKLGTKEMTEKLMGVWLQEAPELNGFSAGVLSNIVKAALSSAKARERLAYRRDAEIIPRTAVLVGTTNADVFLDPEGEHRRFMCARVGRVNKPWIEEHREDLWAEAVNLYRQGVDWWWEGDEEARLKTHNASFKEIDPWEDPIRVLVDGKAKVRRNYSEAGRILAESLAAKETADVLLTRRKTEAEARRSAKSAAPHSFRDPVGDSDESIVDTLVAGILRATGNYLSEVTLATGHRLGAEASALCTTDTFEAACLDVQAGRRGKRDESRVVSVFKRLGCEKYTNGTPTSGHPALRIRGKLARWYLPPEPPPG